MEAQVGGERGLVLSGRHPVLEALRSGTRPIDEILVEGEGPGTRHRDILALARERAKTVSIHVEKNNPARRLYERLGFVETGRTETHYRMVARPSLSEGR